MSGVRDIRVIELKGSARARGLAHGETLRADIHELFGKWKENIRQDMDIDPDVFLEQMVTETDFIPAVKKWTPELLEEVEGIAEGAGVDFNTVFARQLSDEELWFRILKKIECGINIAENCSSLGVTAQAGLPNIIAQTMDMPEYCDGHQVLLHIKHQESDLEELVFTVAGKISLAGMNNAPIGICCNTVMQLNHNRVGLPEDFIVRAILARATIEDALDFLYSIKHASGQNYVLGGVDRVLDLECSANKICQFEPYPMAGRVFHTNHPVANDDQSTFRDWLAQIPPEKKHAFYSRMTTERRFAVLARAMSDLSAPLTIGQMIEILSSHEGPVCIDGDGRSITLGCLIMELSGTPVLHLAPGPPCSTEFKEYRF